MYALHSTYTKIDPFRFEIPRRGSMRVPGRLYTSEHLLPQILTDMAVQQVINVAHLPGIVGASLAMPDMHEGYGFPIGGVAAFEIGTGVISPGGIGYDISCGVRLMRTDIMAHEVHAKIDELLKVLFAAVPSGIGSTGRIKLTKNELKEVLRIGAQWTVQKGYGDRDDLRFIEDNGRMEGSDPDAVSSRAFERGSNQLGTLGSGNHFLEIQEVTDIYDPHAAEAFGLFKGQLTVMIHTGSRGLGYQICDDYIKVMAAVSRTYGINLPDRQLACAPLTSPEGKRYFSAMAAAANFARANRHIIGSWVHETLARVLNMTPAQLGVRLVYDVSHNIGNIEEHVVDGKKITVCVHRKGATRALPAGSSVLPDEYRSVGQPVIIPGSMGTASYVMVGTDTALAETFGSTCHGAGRVMSRAEARRRTHGQTVKEELNRNNIFVYTDSYAGLAEEMPAAYKNIDAVVDVCHHAGISRKVARMIPRGVIKG